MDAELRFHIEAYAEDLMRSGLPRSEAMRRSAPVTPPRAARVDPMVALQHDKCPRGALSTIHPSAQSDFHLASFLKSYKTIRAELQHGRLPDMTMPRIAARLFLLLVLLPSVFALAQDL
jgi:hypothetical protein